MITNPEQLIEWLNKLPAMIRDQEKVLVEKQASLDRAKLKLSVTKAEVILRVSGNATEKNACATKETEKEQKEVIKAQEELDKSKVTVDYLNNRFVSLRKISSIETEMMKSQLGGS